MSSRLLAFTVLVSISSINTFASAPSRPAPNVAASPAIPQYFEENRGQSRPETRFLSRGSAYSVFVTDRGAVLSLPAEGKKGAATVRMTILGAQQAAGVTGEGRLAGSSSYLRGNDRRWWVTGVPHYDRVRLRSVRPGLDVLFYHSNRQLEYDLVLAAGADPANLGVRFEGQKSIAIRDGEVAVETAAGEVRQRKPDAWQEVEGRKRMVPVQYALSESGEVRFRLGKYDHTRPLTIDPEIVYGTYLPASPTAMAVNSAGEAYLTGSVDSSSTDFAATTGVYDTTANGYSDAFVMKLDATGSSVLFATYLGGSSDDRGGAIALDAVGNIYVAGRTSSSDFPATYDTRPAQNSYTVFLAKLSPTGSEVTYSVLFPANYTPSKLAVAVDSSYSAYLALETRALKTTAGAYLSSCADYAIGIAKLSPAGDSLLYATCLGGSQSETLGDMTIDASGAVYVTGMTYSFDFPTTAGAYARSNSQYGDAFVAKLNPSASGVSSLVYSTYLGGSGADNALAIAVDPLGNAYVGGTTTSTDFPTTPGAYSTLGDATSGNAFVTKLNSTGTGLLYSTYLGGNGADKVTGLNVDASGQAILAGYTASNNFPTTTGSVMQYVDPYKPAMFLAELAPDGTAVSYSATIGPSDSNSPHAAAYDGHGVYLLGTTAAAAPTTPGSYRPAWSGSSTIGYLVKVDLDSVTVCGAISLSPATLNLPAVGGTGSFDVTAPAGCAWFASSSSSQVELTNGSGIGNGRIDFTVPPQYAGVASQSYQVTAGGAVGTVQQELGDCSQVVITASPVSFGAGGGVQSVHVAAPARCSLSPSTSVGWLTISSTSDGTITLSAEPNSFTARAGTLFVGDGSVIVNQDAGSCTLALSSTAAQFPSQGGTGGIPFTTSAGNCTWRAWTNDSWIRVDSPAGSGSSALAFTVMANPLSAARTGGVYLDGRTVTVTQAAGTTTNSNTYWINTLAGNGDIPHAHDAVGDGGNATSVGLYYPAGVALDQAGNLYIAEDAGRIRKVAPYGTAVTLIGGGSDSTEGALPLRTSVGRTGAVAVAPTGIVYYADFSDSTQASRIRKLDADGKVYTVAGSGSNSGVVGDNGPATSASIGRVAGLAFDSAGNLYIPDSSNHRVRRVDTNGIITTVAGTGTPGFSGDGNLATEANLNFPRGVLVDASGNLYISDALNQRIRKIGPDGKISTIAGTGTEGFSGDGGSATAAAIRSPYGLALDAAGNVIFSDTGNARIRRIDASGNIATIAGNGQVAFAGDGGPALSASLKYPASVAGDGAGNLYVADYSNYRIRKLSPGSFCSFAVTSSSTGSTLAATAGSLSFTVTPSDSSCAWNAASTVPWLTVASGASGTGNGSVRVSVDANSDAGARAGTLAIAGKTFVVNQADSTQTGTGCVLTLGSSIARIDSGFGTGSVAVTVADGCTWAAWSNASWLEVTAGSFGTGSGAVGFSVTVNSGGSRTGILTIGGQTFTVIQSASPYAYLITTVAGGGLPRTAMPAVSASIPWPSTVAADAAGNLYFIAFNCVFKVDARGTLIRVAGASAIPGYSGDGGPAISAQLNGPVSLALDTSGNLYIAEWANPRIRKVTPSGIITTVAGNGAAGSAGDGGTATDAQIGAPGGIAVDGSGNLYITAPDFSRVRKVTPNGTITTVAGTGIAGYSGDGTPAVGAQLNHPTDVAVDGAGNLFIADKSNRRIRKVAPNGIITTVAGTGDPYGYGNISDGVPAVSACVMPSGVAADEAGNLYFSDDYTSRIRKVTPDGTITSVAWATNAALYRPAGIALDGIGNLYVADYGNSRIRKVTSNGIISTVAGNGEYAFAGDAGQATAAQLGYPYGVTLDVAGNLYVADRNNNRIRKVAPNGTITTVAGNGVAGYSGDGGQATGAQLDNPDGVAVDGSGSVYIADSGNNRVRKVAPDGTITTVAGNGYVGYGHWDFDGAQATNAQLKPRGVAVDGIGNLYIVDISGHAILKVAPSGIITSVASAGSPAAVATDAAGNLYFTDNYYAYNASRVRELAANGTITTVAELSGGYEFTGIAVDAAGSVYMTNGSRVLKTMSDGSLATMAGGGTSLSDGGPATVANIHPGGIAMGADGSFYVSDSTANVVRKLVPFGVAPVLAATITHTDVAAGQTSVTSSVVVSNAANAAATSETVAVTDLLPTGLTLTSMSGTGWTCSSNTCTRSDALGGGSSYPAITVLTNLAANAPVQMTNQITVITNSSATSADDVVNLPAIPAPVPRAVTPASGTGSTQTFQFVFTDPDGGSDIAWALALVNTAVNSASACYVEYDGAHNRLYLVNDVVSGLLGPLTPGAAGSVENSQCRLDAGASSITVSDTVLTVNAALTFKSAFAGTKNVYLLAVDRSGHGGGFIQLGTWQVSAPVNAPPVPVSVSPSSGSGATQTFQFVFTDPDGAGDIAWALALVNTAISSGSACYVEYDGAHNRLYLVNDVAGGLLGLLTPGVAGGVENSQCRLDAGASSITVSGTRLTVNAALTFKPGFAGTKNVYLLAVDRSAHSSQFVPLGTWQVPGPANAPPVPVSVSPSSGSGATQTFQFVFTDPDGAGDIAWALALVNTAISSGSACYVEYDGAHNRLYLVNDVAGGLLGPLTPGVAGGVENSQCRLDAGASSVTASGTTLTVNAALTFKPGFAGTKNVYLLAVDRSGHSSQFVPLGTWQVPGPANAPPVPVSVSPSSGSGASHTFQFVFTDPDGGSDIAWALALVNTAISSGSACYVEYDGAHNRLYLVNDVAGGLLGPLTPGTAGSVENSQCRLDAGASSVTASGTTLTVNAALTFKPGFAGTKNVYLLAVDRSGHSNGFVQKGTWNVP